jgi:hypothetical protein
MIQDAVEAHDVGSIAVAASAAPAASFQSAWRQESRSLPPDSCSGRLPVPVAFHGTNVRSQSRS